MIVAIINIIKEDFFMNIGILILICFGLLDGRKEKEGHKPSGPVSQGLMGAGALRPHYQQFAGDAAGYVDAA